MCIDLHPLHNDRTAQKGNVTHLSLYFDLTVATPHQRGPSDLNNPNEKGKKKREHKRSETGRRRHQRR
jgi:hypothetical protein